MGNISISESDWQDVCPDPERIRRKIACRLSGSFLPRKRVEIRAVFSEIMQFRELGYAYSAIYRKFKEMSILSVGYDAFRHSVFAFQMLNESL